MIRVRRRRLPAVPIAGVVIAACSVHSGRNTDTPLLPPPATVQSESNCAPVTSALPADARSELLSGDFRLVLVATSGARAGHRVAGTLALQAFTGTNASDAKPSTESARRILSGRATVVLDSVGATAAGPIDVADPNGPGVLGLEWSRVTAGVPSREITLRFGATANRGDARPFDGTHMALFVNSISPTRFTGRWDSGAGDIRADGHFCAERVGAR